MNESKMEKLRGFFDDFESEDPAQISSEYAELTQIDNRYERQELIGEGGMKKVWRVYDHRTRATLAYAEPNDDLHPVFYDVMLDEAWRTASLSHPNIIKIHDTGTDGHPFFTMDLKYGDTLKKWKMRRNPSLDDCLEVFLKVCDAMIHAHSRNVLHLDLKPDNIQIEGLNEVVVCDWGSGDGEGATPGYMAPEQSDIKNPKDQRTDIYGLGAVLYFLLTGESSAKGETAHSVIENTAIGIELPHSRFPELRVPSALDQIVARAMAVEPDQRYGSVKELGDDIIKFRNLRPTSRQERKVLTCGWLFYLRNQLSCNLALISCLAIIFGGGWGMKRIEQYRNEHQAQKARADQAEKESLVIQNQLKHETEEKMKLGIDAAPRFYAKAMNQLNFGDLDAALDNAKTAIRLNAEDVEARNLLGAIYFLKKDYDQAQRLFTDSTSHLYQKIKKLNALRAGQNYTLEQEKEVFIDLFHYCQLVATTPVTEALFRHFAADSRQWFSEQSLNWFREHIESSAYALQVAAQLKDSEKKARTVEVISRRLLQHKEWIHRRIPMTHAMQLAKDPLLRKSLRKQIPGNLALGQPVTASENSIRPPEEAVDGVGYGDSSWSSSSCPAHITVDLGAVHQVKKFMVRFRTGTQGVYHQFIVEVSTDNIHFQKVVDQTQNTVRSNKALDYAIQPVDARFVRLTVTANNLNLGAHVREFEVY